MTFNIKNLRFKLNSDIKLELINKNVVILKNIITQENSSYKFPSFFYISISEDNTIYLINDSFDTKLMRFYGLYKKLFFNSLDSLLKMFEKTILLSGIGYKFVIENKNLKIQMGFSHLVLLSIPNDINLVLESNTKLKVLSKNNINLGNFCSKILSVRKFNFYKGKGAKFENESFILKEGKKRK